MNSQSKKIIAGVLLAAVAILGVRKMQSMGDIAGGMSLQRELAAQRRQAAAAAATAAAAAAEQARYDATLAGRGRKLFSSAVGLAAPLAPYKKAIAKRASQFGEKVMKPVSAIGRGFGALGRGIYGYAPGMPEWAKNAWSTAGSGLHSMYDKFKGILPAKETISQAAGNVDQFLRLDKIPFEKWQKLSPETRLGITAGVLAAAAGVGYAAYSYMKASPQAQQLAQLEEQVRSAMLNRMAKENQNKLRLSKFYIEKSNSSGNLNIGYRLGHSLNTSWAKNLTDEVIEKLANAGIKIEDLNIGFVYIAAYKWQSGGRNDIFYTVWGLVTEDGKVVEAHDKDESKPTEFDDSGFNYTGLLENLSQESAMEEVEEAPAPSKAWYNPRRYIG